MSEKIIIKNNSKSRRGFLNDLTKWIGGTALLATAANIFSSNKVKADTASTNSSEPFIGQIIMFAGNFAPRGWAFCDGQLLQIAQHTALFSILGTTYGGDGEQNFALPDLRGRVPIHTGGNNGTGPGLSSYSLGQKGGSETNTLTVAQMPSHSHNIPVLSIGGTSDNPVNNYMASNSEGIKHYSDAATPYDFGKSTANTGASQSVNNMQPYLTINFVIAIAGTFPARI